MNPFDDTFAETNRFKGTNPFEYESSHPEEDYEEANDTSAEAS